MGKSSSIRVSVTRCNRDVSLLNDDVAEFKDFRNEISSRVGGITVRR